MFRGINNDRRIYINIDDSMGLLKERRRLLDLDLRLLHRRDRGSSRERGAAVVNLSVRARGPGRSPAPKLARSADAYVCDPQEAGRKVSDVLHTAAPGPRLQLPEMSLSSGKLLG